MKREEVPLVLRHRTHIKEEPNGKKSHFDFIRITCLILISLHSLSYLLLTLAHWDLAPMIEVAVLSIAVSSTTWLVTDSFAV